MTQSILLYGGAIVIIVWGIAHIAPTSKVVKGFGDISRDNKLVVVQTWVSEGLALCFIGVLVLLAKVLGEPDTPLTTGVIVACGAMLLLMAAWHLPTGARTNILPMKICVGVLTVVGTMFLTGALI